MKKISLFTVILSIFVLLFASSAFASSSGSFDTYPVADNSDKVVHSEFNLGETPYIYISLPTPPTGWTISKVETNWYLGDVLKGEKTKTFHANEYWITLDSYDWFNKSDVGTWNVSVAFKYYGYPPTKILSSGSGNTSFTMKTIPEPVSTLLFLSGGAVLLGRRLLKEKK